MKVRKCIEERPFFFFLGMRFSRNEHAPGSESRLHVYSPLSSSAFVAFGSRVRFADPFPIALLLDEFLLA